ncbi:MAG: hypothetical protein J5534_07325 [Fibrobacter sp.]|nr:hypothetical protein [Fibrobacter sp.]
MKKLILILSILALNVFAAGCRDYMRLSVSFWNFDEYRLDSLYGANYFGSLVYYSESKFYYKNGNLISTVRCYGDDCEYVPIENDNPDSIVKCNGDCEYAPIEIVTEKTDISTNRTIYIDGILSEEERTSLKGDSSTLISYHMMKDTISDEEIASLDSSVFAYIRIIQNRVFFKDGVTINFLKNDTLKKIEIKTDMPNLESEMKKITVITPDPSNENLCNFTVYEPVENDTALQSLTKQNIISEYQATITNTEKGFIVSFSNSEEKWLYTLASEPTTSTHRKIRPAIILEKSKKFDLLGRPAKSEHIIKVGR